MPSLRSMSPTAALAAGLALSSGAAGAASADPASGALHRQVDAIFAPWSGPDTPGCAVGVSRAGVPEHVRGYGMANLEHAIAIAPDSVFQSGSIAKQFTAFSVGLLAQEGKLSLDHDIRRYLPELPDYARTITIAQLIHHTGGLREQGQLLNLAGWRGDDLYTEADILRVLARQRATNFAAGSEVVYGNAGYTLLAIIVRRASGQSLRAFAEQRIFQPLGMADTRFNDDHNELLPRRAAGYSPRAGGGWRTSIPNIDHYGSTSLMTSVRDLLKWQHNLIDARVGGRALIQWMRRSGRLNDGSPTGYGGGLRLAPYRGLRTFGHDGADGGYRADTIAFPDQQLAVAVLCNGATVAPEDLARKIADAYLGEHMSAATQPPAVAMAAAGQAALAGVYWSASSDEILRLEWRDGALRQAGAPTALVPIGGGVFRPGDSPHRWRFVAPRGAAQAELHIVDFWPAPRRFVRVDEALPDASALAAFGGRYRSEEVEMTYTVRALGDRLAIAWPRREDVILQPVGGDRFVGALGTVSFTRAASGEVDGLTISQRRLRRFRAERIAAETAPE